MGSLLSHAWSDEDILSIGHIAIRQNRPGNQYVPYPAYIRKSECPYSSVGLEDIDETENDECESDEETPEEEHCETNRKSQVLDQNRNAEKEHSLPPPKAKKTCDTCEPEVMEELALALAKPPKQGSRISSGVKKVGTTSGTASPQKKIASPPAERENPKSSSTSKGNRPASKEIPTNSSAKSSKKPQNLSKLCKEKGETSPSIPASPKASILKEDEQIIEQLNIIDKRKSLLQITANFKPTDGQDLVKMKYKLNLQTKEETFSSEASVERLIEFDLVMDNNGNPDPKLFPQSLPKLMNRFEGTVLLDGYLISMDRQQSQRFKVMGLDVHAEPPVLMIRPKNLKGLDIVHSSTKFEVRVQSEFGPQNAKWIRIEGTKVSQIKTLSPEGSGKLYILLA